MIWGAPNFWPKSKLMKLNFSQNMKWLPAFFCLKNVHIKKTKFILFAIHLFPYFSDKKVYLKYYTFQKTEYAPYILIT